MGQRLSLEAKELNFTPTLAVASALERLGRTEDLQFSADGRKLAIAGFDQSRLLIVDLHFETKTHKMIASDFLEVTSPNLQLPHGLSWINNTTIIVANRIGDLTVFQLPKRKPASRYVHLKPMATIGRAEFAELNSPGSVSVTEISKNQFEILVCNNYAHMISRHELDMRKGFSIKNQSVYLKARLDVPDGVVHSSSGRFIGVSNHNGKCVHIYDRRKTLNAASLPSGTLTGLGYPHGLRFSEDERFLFVADAAQPFVHVYFDNKAQWLGENQPVTAIRVMDDAAFIRGQVNPEEGGPKGLALSRDNSILAVTCEEAPLTFYDIRSLLSTESFPAFVKPEFPKLPEKPRQGLWQRAWKFCRGKLKV